MELVDRAESYNRAFPRYPEVAVSHGWLVGAWMIGANYKGSGYYGAFPPSYLDRIHALFPDKELVCQLFAGSVKTGRWPEEVTVDINPEVNPDLRVDIGEEEWYADYLWERKDLPGERPWSEKDGGPFDLVIADPPYTEEDARHYGTPLVNRNKVVRDCVNLLQPGGHLVWLDQVFPVYRKAELDLVGTIGLIRSTNHRVRCTFVWVKPCSSS